MSAGRRHRPCSVLIALQDHSGLKLYDGQGTGFVVELSKGDVLIFAGDMPHNGLHSRSEVVNFRLFGYFPTIWSEVPWSTKGCEESGISVDQHEVRFNKRIRHGIESEEVARTRDELLDSTDPQLHTFEPEEYSKTLFDRMNCKFYHFSYEMWYGGIDTAKIRPDEESVYTGYCSRYASSIPVVSRCAYSPCEHFVLEDFWHDWDTADKGQKKLCRAILSKYRKDCVYCVLCTGGCE